MLSCDVIERLIDFSGSDIGDRSLRVARRAMQDAYREFPGLHRWTYHYAHGRLQLKQSYSDGTVAYDHSTLTVTLTGGTWPSWAEGADIRISDVVSEVDEVLTSTTLKLSATVNPGADVDAGSAYTIYKDRYTLPDDFLASDAAIAESMFGQLRYVGIQNWLSVVRCAETSGTPVYFTVVPDRHLAGRYAMLIWPFPDRDQTLDFVYQRRLRPIRYDSESAGKVSISGTTVTGVGTSFKSNMVGSYIRISSSSKEPTSVEGDNPAEFESKITAVASATSLTVADSSSALSGVAYKIADPIDIEDGVMANAFYWQAMSHAAADLRMKDRETIDANAVKTLIMAKEHDSRSFARDHAGPGVTRRQSWVYMPTGPDEG